MHGNRLIILFCALCACIGAAEDQPPTVVVQKLFDAMSAHDGAAARTLFIPDAMLYSIGRDGAASGLPFEKFVEHLGSSKDAWLERTWNPKVLEHGTVAVVWADYDFHLNGKFSHCGVDSFNLLKTPGGWKIASVADTRETSGCPSSPLGPPAK